MSEYWKPGDTVVRREVRRGAVVGGRPLRVVSDDWEMLVTWFAPGSDTAVTPGRTPAADRELRHGRLTLLRPDDAYAVDALWEGSERTFAGWEIRLQDPVRRGERTIDTVDHGLSFRVRADGTWSESGREEFERLVQEGHWSAAEAASIRSTATGIGSMLQWRNQWWDRMWESWRPPAYWTSLRLPQGWAGRAVA